ncbi:MAG: hypothetical protein ACT4OD_05670 [Candidatus Nitrosotenuis sp.]
MILIQATKQKPLIALASAIGIFFLNPLIQSISTSLAFQIWFADILQKPFNASLYISFSVLFGMFVSLYLFSKNQCVDCKPNVKSGIGGSALGFMLGVCPACFSFVGFLLPLSGSLFLTAYSPLFMLISIGVIVFSIYKMAGFRRVSTARMNLDP